MEKYTKLKYNTGPVPYGDFINDKYNKVHVQLYTDALQKFLESEEGGKYKSDYEAGNIKIREAAQGEYFQAPYILIYGQMNNNSVYKMVSLENYWSNYQYNIKVNKPAIFDIDEELRDAKVIRIDYLNKRALLYSRYTDTKFWVDLNHILGVESDPDYSLKNTFTHLEYNKV